MVDGLTRRGADLCCADADCRFLAIFSAGPSSGLRGDIIDRRKLILFTESWVMCVALILAILTIAGVMSPWILLVLTFALSAGDAFETPAWGAILPELVPKEGLAAASALNGIEFNLARAVGPVLAGTIISVAGVATAFVTNFRIDLRCHSCCCQVEKACPQEERAAGIFFGSYRRRNSIRPALSRNPDGIAQNRRSHILLQRPLRVAADGFSKCESECNRLWPLARLLWWRCNHRRFGHAVSP